MSGTPAALHMRAMTTAPENLVVDPATEPDPTCDRFRDLMADDPEFAGKVILTCDKPLGHDRRGGHRMRNKEGKTTCTWTGPADND